MSQQITQLLERLAKMFTQQNYQSCLEQYLSTKSITSTADVEYWQRQYNKHSDRSFV